MKKLIYRFQVLLLTCFFMVTSTSLIIAESSIDPHAPDKNDPERIMREEEKYAEASQYNESKKLMRSSNSNFLSVYQNVQETDYWCGPASAQVVIRYPGVDGRLIAQSTLARDMGTNASDGTYVYKLAQEVSAYSWYYDYGYSSNYEKHFSNVVVKMIDDGHPMIYHVDTRTLNPQYSFSNGHYVVGSGYSWGASGSSGYMNVQYFDPWRDSSINGKRSISADRMSQAINNQAGYYIW